MSDILIKNMKMPKDCFDCPIGECLSRYELMEGRPEDCPLVEVQAHGDLIDRDLWLATHWVSEQVSEAIKDSPVVLEATE